MNNIKIIYDTMLECYEQGEIIDPLLVIERLKKRQKLAEVGGEEEIVSIYKSVPTAANIENYASIGEEIYAVVLNVDEQKKHLNLSIKNMNYHNNNNS